MKYYYCVVCGNLLETIDDSGVNPECCGKKMEELEENEDETASIEKHIPVYTVDGNKVCVYVGERQHPSTNEHYIAWIELQTNKGVYRKIIKPTELPEACFTLCGDEKIIKISAYCNIHGLWVNR